MRDTALEILVVLIIAALAYVAGVEMGIRAVRREAANSGVAYWTTDTNTGDATFKWGPMQ